MRKLNYTAPAVEIIELAVEGIIAFSNLRNEPGGGNVVNSSRQAAATNSSYSMDDYKWQ